MFHKTLNLRDTQRLLWRLISAPEGVRKAVRNYRIRTLPIAGDLRLKSEDRLDIYANMYFFRILDCLKEDFPSVLKVVGKSRFHNLITDYLLKHPPRHWSLRYVGDRLSAFIRQHVIRKKYPFLGELAEMEWLLIEAFDAADETPLNKEALKNINPPRWGEIPLALHPSVHMRTFRWPVDRIGKKMKREKTDLVLWRQGFKICYQRIKKEEREMLRTLRKGVDLGSLCEAAAGIYTPNEVASKVAGFLQKWVENGLITGEYTASGQ